MFKIFNNASIGIAFFLLSSHLGLMLPKFFPLPSFAGFAFFALGVMPLWWNRRNAKLIALGSPRMRLIRLYFFFICFIAFTSAAASVVDYGVNSSFKTGGLIIVFSSLLFCSGYYSGNDLRNGLILYSIFELGLLYFTKSEWNANAVASRAATAAITGYFLLPYFILGLSLLALGLTIAFRFQARTVLLSMIFSYTAVYFSKEMQKNALIPIALFIAFVAAALFSAEGLAALRTRAKSSLNSQDQISKFFLSDKTEKDIEGDFFDRQIAWSNGIKNIQKQPFIGIGLGNETKAGQLESHNAYLSLAVEGGLPSLILWLLFYIEIGKCLLSYNPNDNRTYYAQLMSLALFLFVYMLLSGFLEKSGVGSILSPNNIICCLIAFWSIQQSPAIYSNDGHQTFY